MATEQTYPHIEQSQGSTPRLTRWPRIRVAQIVMDYLAHGWSPDEMCRQHPGLRLAEVHSAMAFYYDHQDEIDGEIAAEVRDLDHSPSTPESQVLTDRLRAFRKG